MNKIEMCKIHNMMVAQMFTDSEIRRMENLMFSGYIVKEELGEIINHVGGNAYDLYDDAVAGVCEKLDEAGFKTYGYYVWNPKKDDDFERIIHAVLNTKEYRKHRHGYMFRDVLPDAELENMEFADAVNKIWK